MKEEHGDKHTKRYGMVIDLDKCTGCGACMVACYAENNVPFKKDETDKLDSLNWIRIFQLTNGKPYPDTEICYLPMPCQHCDGIGKHGHPPCVSVCPAIATDYDDSTGVVSQIPTRCFGCRYCMAACPYHARKFNWWDPVWPADTKKYLNPNVSTRMRGVVEKCTLCFHRTSRPGIRRTWKAGRKSMNPNISPHAPKPVRQTPLPSGTSTIRTMRFSN